PDVLPDAHARAARDATARLHVHAGWDLGVVQPDLDDRVGSDGAGSRFVPVQRGEDVSVGLAGRERPVARGHPGVVHDVAAAAAAALGSFLAAALVTGRPAHIALAGLAFAASLVAVAGCFRGEPVARASVRDYVTLTKPRIMTLLLLTGAAGMFVGAQGLPELSTFVVTMLGLALACGGASALNHVLDRDIDRLMPRTGERPVAGERIAPARALEFGLALSAFSFVLLASLVNVLTAVLALVGSLLH